MCELGEHGVNCEWENSIRWHMDVGICVCVCFVRMCVHVCVLMLDIKLVWILYRATDTVGQQQQIKIQKTRHSPHMNLIKFSTLINN